MRGDVGAAGEAAFVDAFLVDVLWRGFGIRVEMRLTDVFEVGVRV